MAEMASIRKVLQNHGRGVITDAELAAALFPMLTPENLKEFLVIVSPAVVQVLTREARDAPRTEDGWRDMRIDVTSTVVAREGEIARRAEADQRARHRKGVEALRRHLEGGA